MAVQNIVMSQTTQPNALHIASGIVAPSSTLEVLEGATAALQFVDKMQVKPDSFSKSSFKSVMRCKPLRIFDKRERIHD